MGGIRCSGFADAVGQGVLPKRSLQRSDPGWMSLALAARWQIMIGDALIPYCTGYHDQLSQRKIFLKYPTAAADDELAAPEGDRIFHKSGRQRGTDSGMKEGQTPILVHDLIDRMRPIFPTRTSGDLGVLLIDDLLDDFFEEADHTVF